MASYIMDKILSNTLHIIHSSQRAMPAHFTSNGDRMQSFCVDYEPLSAEDEYEMASEAWGSVSDYMVDENGLSASQSSLILRCGEDIMLGAYILTKEGRPDLVEEYMEIVITDTLEEYKDMIKRAEPVLQMPASRDYFRYCADFGQRKGK